MGNAPTRDNASSRETLCGYDIAWWDTAHGTWYYFGTMQDWEEVLVNYSRILAETGGNFYRVVQVEKTLKWTDYTELAERELGA